MTFALIFLSCLIPLLLFISAYFSASETAITAVSKAKIHHLTKQGDAAANKIKELQQHVGLVISALLIGNTLFNTWATTLATGVLISLFGHEGVAYASLIMSVLIIIYAEVLPKIYAVSHSEKFLLRTATFLKIIFTVFRPITTAIHYFANISLRLLGVKTPDAKDHLTLEELRGTIDLHHGPGHEVPHERAMLKSILDLRSVQVHEIMVHRKNVTMIDADDPPVSIIDQVLASPFTRMPIWKDDADNIVGVLNSKALVRAVRAHSGDVSTLDILAIANKPWFIPENTDLLEQLQAFRERREHFAIVVDEYGSLMGIVTLEDVLEEIVGEISDEHDIAVRGVRPQEDGSYIIDGNVTIRDLNRQFDWDLPDENASTLAGLVLYEVRIIPEVGQVFVINNFRIEVLRRQRNHLTLLRVTPNREQPNSWQ